MFAAMVLHKRGSNHHNNNNNNNSTANGAAHNLTANNNNHINNNVNNVNRQFSTKAVSCITRDAATVARKSCRIIPSTPSEREREMEKSISFLKSVIHFAAAEDY